MVAMMGLRPSPLLAFLVVMSLGSVIAVCPEPKVYKFCDRPDSKPINLTAESHPFFIKSRRDVRVFPFDYYCSLVMKSGNDPLIVTIQFRNIRGDAKYMCYDEYLCIHGVKFCGAWMNGWKISYILPENSRSTLVLSITELFSSIYIRVTTDLAVTSSTVQEPRGYGFRESQLYFENVTYSQGMNYSDLCTHQPKVYTLCKRPNKVHLTPQSTPFTINNLRLTNVDPFGYYCTLVLKSGKDPLILTFQFRKLRAKYNDMCSNDNLCIHGVKFCGDWMNGSVISYILPENSTSTLVFSIYDTSSSIDIPDQICEPGGSVIVKVNPYRHVFTIRSPRFNTGLHTVHTNCSIILESGSVPLVVNLYFDKFHVPWSDKCRSGYFCMQGIKYCGDVLLYQGINVVIPENRQSTLFFTSSLIDNATEFEIRVAIHTPPPKWTDVPVHVNDNMTSIVTKKVSITFEMNYTDVCSSTNNTELYEFCNPSQAQIVRLNATSPQFVIQSQKWGARDYINFANCSIVLTSGPEPLILLFNYSQFYLEESRNCEHDYLCVNGVKLCDVWSKSYVYENILPKNSEFTIYFKTNGNVTHSGFKIYVTPRRAVKHERVTGIGVYMQSVHEIIDERFVYTPGQSNVDRCSASRLTTTDKLPTMRPPRAYKVCDMPESNVITLTPQNQSFLIDSPYYIIDGTSMRHYCSLVLKSEKVPLVLTFHFRRFSVSGSANCSVDYLCLHGVRVCGPAINGSNISFILPENQQSTLILYKEWSTSYVDFQILVTSEPADNGRVVNEVRNFEYGNNALHFENVTYSVGMSYNDICGQPPHAYRVCDKTVPTVITLTPQSQPFLIYSPTYRIVAPISDYCSLVLKTGKDPLVLTFHFRAHRSICNDNIQHENGTGCIQRFSAYVKLHIEEATSPNSNLCITRSFNVAESANCSVDYLCLNRVKFCGTVINGSRISFLLPENQQSTLALVKKGSTSDVDFDILVTSEPADNGRVVNEVRNFEYRNNALYFENVTYSVGMYYNDICGQRYQVYTLCDTDGSNVVKLSPGSLPFTIHSPNYGISDYPSNVNCSLVLESGNDPLILTFYFKTFRLGYNNDCTLDFLCVHGINLCASFINGHTISYILPDKTRSTVFLKTNSTKGMSGFEIQVTPEQATSTKRIQEARSSQNTANRFYVQRTNYFYGMPNVDFCSIPHKPRAYDICNENDLITLSPDSQPFVIYSPNVNSSGYHFGTNCSLVLKAGNDSLLLTFYFSKFDVEYHDDCSYDSLCILGVKLCGREIDYNGEMIHFILPKHGNDSISYNTDLSLQGLGFEVKKTHELCHPGNSRIVALNASGNTFIVQSPFWPKRDYPNSLNCSLILQSGSEPLLLSFSYSKFSVERSENCTHDYLCVNGVKLCGNWTRTTHEFTNILPEESNMTILFRTNCQFTMPGFEILVTSTLAVNNEAVTEVTTYEPFNHHFQYETVAYYPGIHYQDGCSVS